MQIGSGDDRFPGAQGIRQGSRHDLALMFVGRDVNVCRTDQFDELLRADETIPKDHTILNPEISREFLEVQPIFVALVSQDMRVGDAGNHVNGITVTRQDTRQSLDYVFYTLVWGEQSKREQNVFSLRSESILIKIRIGKVQIGDTVGNEIDFVGRDLEDFLQNIGGLPAHDNQAVQQSCNLLHDHSLV